MQSVKTTSHGSRVALSKGWGPCEHSRRRLGREEERLVKAEAEARVLPGGLRRATGGSAAPSEDVQSQPGDTPHLWPGPRAVFLQPPDTPPGHPSPEGLVWGPPCLPPSCWSLCPLCRRGQRYPPGGVFGRKQRDVRAGGLRNASRWMRREGGAAAAGAACPCARTSGPRSGHSLPLTGEPEPAARAAWPPHAQQQRK